MLPYGRQWIDGDDIAVVAEQLRGGWLTQGPTVSRFESALAEYCGARYAVAVSSGTAALHIAALAAGIRPGSVGITSAITFVASANCIAYCGGRPSFADITPETGLIDLADLRRRCDALDAAGSPPAVLIPVDFAGQPADLPGVRTIADRFGAIVIEDAAHSLGATYSVGGATYRCGSCVHSDLAILSFHPVKHITTGEGGAVLTNDAGLFKRLSALRSHGITREPADMVAADGPWYYEQHDLGFNYRITDFQCALGLSQLGRLDAFVARRRDLAAQYDAAFGQEPFLGRVRPLVQRHGSKNSYHLYVVNLIPVAGQDADDVRADRLRLFEHMVERGIRPQVHYIPVPRQPYFCQRFDVVPSGFPGAMTYYAGCLSLPLFPAMEESDVDRVVGVIAEGLDSR
ncbi:MAG: UDP-4-amino-4,6-dideoxy-N-acetyl-beta-L-altrosamine transaminase [Thermoanaerobaculaceae bacterium]